MTNLGLLLADRGDTRDAIALLRRSTRLRPQREVPWLGLAAIYESQGQLPAAEKNYRMAIRANRLSADTQLRLARVLERQEKRAQAAKRYRRALALDPTLEEAREALARVDPPNEP